MDTVKLTPIHIMKNLYDWLPFKFDPHNLKVWLRSSETYNKEKIQVDHLPQYLDIL